MIIVSLVGLKKSGKTTVVEAPIREFKRCGCKVGGIKIMHRAVISIDIKAKETLRQKEAGADFVVSLSKNEMGYLERLERLAMLSDAAPIIPKDTDILICEGLVDSEPNVLTVIVAESVELLPVTLEVRGHRENVIALSGIMANETKEHPEFPVFNCTNKGETAKLANLIPSKACEGGKEKY